MHPNQTPLPFIVRYEPVLGIVECIQRSPKKIAAAWYLAKKLKLSSTAVTKYCQIAEAEGFIKKIPKKNVIYYVLPSEEDEETDHKYAEILLKGEERHHKKSLVTLPWMGRRGRPRTKNRHGEGTTPENH